MISTILSIVPWWVPAVLAAGTPFAVMFFFPTLPSWAKTSIIVVLVATAVYAKGRDDCFAEVEKARLAERDRQISVNKSALQSAMTTATHLASERDRLEASLKEIVDEVRNSPGGGSCGLDADSLRRLERLTAPRPQ